MKNNKNKQPSKQKQLAKAYAKREKQGTVGPLQMVGSALGAAGGFLFGGPAGMAAGAALGGSAGKLGGYYTGSGDYRVSENAVLNANFRNNTGTVITHREYITDVYTGTIPGGSTSTQFDISTYPINPGQPKTFPWLAGIASNYEEYEILGMVFSFVSTSGESVAATNTSLGSVVLATEYDPTKPAFANKQAMENYQFAVSAKTSQSQIHAIECKKNLTPVKMLYVRNTALSGTDLRWSDFANFYIATVGHPAPGVNIGELWVTYKIRLNKPRLPITVGLGGQLASGSLYRTAATTVSPLGTVAGRNVGAIGITYLSGTTFSFPALPNMNYLVTYIVNGATTLTGANLIITSGAANRFLFAGGTQANFNLATTTNSTYSTYMECTNTDTDGVIVMTVAATITGTPYVDILVNQWDETV